MCHRYAVTSFCVKYVRSKLIYVVKHIFLRVGVTCKFYLCIIIKILNDTNLSCMERTDLIKGLDDHSLSDLYSLCCKVYILFDNVYSYDERVCDDGYMGFSDLFNRVIVESHNRRNKIDNNL